MTEGSSSQLLSLYEQLSSKPYLDLVPKDLKGNLDFRQNALKLGLSDQSFAQDFWVMCSRDILFYVNAFAWTYNPRKPDGQKVIPFITYDFQDVGILDICKCIEEGEDLLIEKSRDMGASWICLIVKDWFVKFRQMYSFLLVSSKEDKVDKREDPDCLFWKLDFLNKNMPPFLRPEVSRTRMHIKNVTTGGTIDGDSTTGDTSRGGRRTALFFDEFASVEDGYAILKAAPDVSDCCIFNSTPKGSGNAFYDLKMSDIKKLRFHWSEHPDKAAGLYSSDKQGNLIIMDKTYIYEQGFKFILDGKIRSPWYDKECKRRISPQAIAQELDIDYLGSGYQYFDSVILERMMEMVSDPFQTGEFEYDSFQYKMKRWIDNPNGKFKLWTRLTDAQLPVRSRYGLAADIATGTGASNSVLVIADLVTKEKVLEYVDPNIAPHDFAKLSVSLARYFYNAFMIWEANGPGRNYGDQVITAGYRNIYYKTNEKSLGKKETDFPGFFTTRDSKVALLGDYRNALARQEYGNRSYDAIKECRSYVYTNGNIEHSTGFASADPSGARENHGDTVIADALMVKLMSTGLKELSTVDKIDVPIGSFLERRNTYNEKLRKQKDNDW